MKIYLTKIFDEVFITFTGDVMNTAKKNIGRMPADFENDLKKRETEEWVLIPKADFEKMQQLDNKPKVDSLVKNQEITAGSYLYKVTMKKSNEMKIKRLSDGKNGTILITNTQNIAWMKNRKDGIATGFFRDIEMDISRAIADFNNPFFKTNDSYSIAIQQFNAKVKHTESPHQ